MPEENLFLRACTFGTEGLWINKYVMLIAFVDMVMVLLLALLVALASASASLANDAANAAMSSALLTS